MNNTLQTILQTFLTKNPYAPVSVGIKNGEIYYTLPGFSKSGDIWLLCDGDKVRGEARYGNVYEIESYDDLVMIAWGWFIDYRDREPFKQPSEYWVSDFVSKNLLKKENREVYV